MLKLFIIALIVIGGYTIAAMFFPQFINITLYQGHGWTVSTAMVLMLCLAYAGHKMVH